MGRLCLTRNVTAIRPSISESASNRNSLTAKVHRPKSVVIQLLRQNNSFLLPRQCPSYLTGLNRCPHTSPQTTCHSQDSSSSAPACSSCNASPRNSRSHPSPDDGCEAFPPGYMRLTKTHHRRTCKGGINVEAPSRWLVRYDAGEGWRCSGSGTQGL